MQSFFEKVRDFFYDSIDYIIIIAIILGVVLIINWRLDGLFAEENPLLSSNENEATEEDLPDKSKDETETEDEAKSEDEVDSSEDNKDIDEKADDEEDADESSEAIVKVDIPPGSGSSSIAKILKDKGLIEDEIEFVETAIDLSYDTKLRFGEYDIPKNSSIKEILDIITR